MLRNADWQSAKKIGDGLVEVTLSVGVETAQSYRRAGQYTEVSCSAGRAYFVIAQRVGREHGLKSQKSEWRLIVKPVGAVAEALVANTATSVMVCDALGLGFELERAESKHCVVVVAGSGFAAAPPVLWHRIEAGLASQTYLVIGTSSFDLVPGQSELSELRAAGVRVVICASTSETTDSQSARELAHTAGFETYHGFADAWLRAEPAKAAVVVAAGPKGLLESLALLSKNEANVVSELLLNV